MEGLAMHFSRPFSWFGNSTRASCLQEPPGRRGVVEHRSAEVRRGAEERADSSQTALLSRLSSALVPLGSDERGSGALALQVAPLIYNSHVQHHCQPGNDVDPLLASAVVVACNFQPIVMIPAIVLGWQCGFLFSRHVIARDLWYWFWPGCVTTVTCEWRGTLSNARYLTRVSARFAFVNKTR